MRILLKIANELKLWICTGRLSDAESRVEPEVMACRYWTTIKEILLLVVACLLAG